MSKLIEDMDNEVKAIKDELFRLVWFMRGGITLAEVYELDVADRELVHKIIKANLETAKETGMPFF